jgi:PAS domain S-box-containing protein
MAIKFRELKIPYHLIFIFFFLSAGIGIAGHNYYATQKEHIKKEKMYELSTLTSIKVKRIQSWFAERRGDAKIILENPIFGEHIKSWMENPTEKEKNKILKWMKSLYQYPEYTSILLFDNKGNLLLSADTKNKSIGPVAKGLIDKAVRLKKEVVSDIHKSEEVKENHIDTLVPVLENGNFPVGVLLIRINPYNYLYPLIQTWPTQSHTSEVMLLRREGNDALFLNELRHRKNTALSYRLPLNTPFMLSAMAALEKEGIFEATDYRGMPVLAAIQSIPDTPWSLITKIDREEIYAPINQYAQTTGLIVFILILATGTGLGFIWRHQRARYYREKYEAEIKHKRAEEKVLKTESKYQKLSQEFNALLNTIPDSITLISPDMKIIWMNQSVVDRTGKDPANLIGQPCYKAWYDSNIPCECCPVEISLKTQKAEIEYITTPDRRILEARAFPIISEDGEIMNLMYMSRDITEHRKLEAQLLHAQKMEAIGQLTGGIAHEFNNILQAIMSIGSLMQMKIKEDDPLREYVVDLLASADRAANLTQSLLAFGRKQPIYTMPVDINDIVKKTIKFISMVIGEDIEVKTDLSDEELTVMADSRQIEQVLMNLITNARDAMPEGGELIIQTSVADMDEEYIRVHGYGKEGIYALISVTDTGIGMDEITKGKIFDPFFTTKEVGKGTGLGLAIVYGIIKQHNGYINVYSEPKRGTTFRIYLPLTEAIKEEAVHAKEEEAKKIEGTETVLIAEDEGHVRKFTKETLERFGYKVIEAADGDEAIEKFKENEDKIQLLILDVVMPKRSGREVYYEISKIRPDIKVIFVSGYPADVIHEKGVLEESFNFVPKPIPPTRLLELIREVLNK